jgi:hypothetical protein
MDWTGSALFGLIAIAAVMVAGHITDVIRLGTPSLLTIFVTEDSDRDCALGCFFHLTKLAVLSLGRRILCSVRPDHLSIQRLVRYGSSHRDCESLGLLAG